jgi:DNA modification methylase
MFQVGIWKEHDRVVKDAKSGHILCSKISKLYDMYITSILYMIGKISVLLLQKSSWTKYRGYRNEGEGRETGI